MSLFQGPICELQSVSVDNFELDHGYENSHKNKHSSCFFLSHCHADHMKGLKTEAFVAYMVENPTFYLYCSAISKLILSTYSRLRPIFNQIKELTMGLNMVNVPANTDNSMPYDITVSCIPAGHCPGSVMFLYETPKYTILYTGDFRIAVGDVKKFRQLHDGGRVKIIDKIYVDGTFFEESYWQFPSREESISVIIEKIKDWLDADPKNLVKLDMTANYGGEFIIKQVSEAFKCQLHVSESLYNLYQQVPEIRHSFTRECRSTRIHVIIRRYQGNCWRTKQSGKVLCIIPKAAPFKCTKDAKPTIWRDEDKTKNRIAVNYSSHSSYSEIMDILEYLRPKDIFVFTDTFGCTKEKRDAHVAHILSKWKETCLTPPVKRFKAIRSTYYKPINIVIPTSKAHISDDDLDAPLR